MKTGAANDDMGIKGQGDWFRSVFDCLNDAVFIHDVVTGDILEVNQRACEMYGFDADEMRRLSTAALSANTPPLH
ncbi:PAS domain-containing protein [Prosthecobacter fluviatilis]|uniref:PAS domain-containing protein n=1 Tax=Prosthecobacter fluviatilis TaxID=445931 RepID=A0ABW0KRZ0_9BACT